MTRLGLGVRPLSNFEHIDIAGFGLSDWEGYASLLAEKFNYNNTFYHMEPFLDICAAEIPYSEADFFISSDVFEHVGPPVQRAFDGSFRLLKSGGTFVLTVPDSVSQKAVEHYPLLHAYRTVDLDGEWVLVNKRGDGVIDVHRNLVFHGGPGSTLEMRILSRDQTIESLKAAGFVDVQVHGENVPEWGIFYPHQDGVPITARRP